MLINFIALIIQCEVSLAPGRSLITLQFIYCQLNFLSIGVVFRGAINGVVEIAMVRGENIRGSKNRWLQCLPKITQR